MLKMNFIQVDGVECVHVDLVASDLMHQGSISCRGEECRYASTSCPHPLSQGSLHNTAVNFPSLQGMQNTSPQCSTLKYTVLHCIKLRTVQVIKVSM